MARLTGFAPGRDMLPRMNDGFAWWLILVGLAIGVAASWLLIVRLPRDDADVSAAERQEEATWISDAIERHGGVAPLALVDEVLELHAAYLRTPGLLDRVDERSPVDAQPAAIPAGGHVPWPVPAPPPQRSAPPGAPMPPPAGPPGAPRAPQPPPGPPPTSPGPPPRP